MVSDLHLGARLGNDVLARPEPRERLLAALEDVDRMVMLGDIVELLGSGGRRAMQRAEPLLRAVGKRIGGDREVIVVPGNHDAPLVRSWVRGQGSSLAPDAVVPLDATPALAHFTALLAPARVRVHYPGTWLSERVWATHGHYLDRHLVPESSFGLARGLLRRAPRDRAVPTVYEGGGGAALARLELRLAQALPRPLAVVIEDLADLVRAATMPRIPTHLLPERIAPLTAMVLGLQMRRASIPALARVVHRLGVDAEWVLFGHVHRLGPLPGDHPEDWEGPSGRPQIANTGSWLYESRLLHRASPPHPYWPGGAILLEANEPPAAIGLLDELDAAALL